MIQDDLRRIARNPLLKEIKEGYSELFEIVKETSKILKLNEDIVVSDDEIAYLTLHFGAAIERQKFADKPMKLDLGVVCASGIGISSLLSSRIKSTLIEVDHVIPLSVEQVLNDELVGIDLLVATLDIESSIPTVYVNPLLKDEDLNLIRAAMKKVQRKKYYPIEDSKQYNDKIIEELIITEINLTQTIEAVIHSLINKIDVGESMHTKIFDAVMLREKHASLIIEDKRFVMYHASVKELEKPYVVFFRANSPQRNSVYEDIDVGVFMIIPKPALAYDRRTLSNISKIILKEDELIKHIQEKRDDELRKLLRTQMEETYDS